LAAKPPIGSSRAMPGHASPRPYPPSMQSFWGKTLKAAAIWDTCVLRDYLLPHDARLLLQVLLPSSYERDNVDVPCLANARYQCPGESNEQRPKSPYAHSYYHPDANALAQAYRHAIATPPQPHRQSHSHPKP